jgi:hypothetical protein
VLRELYENKCKKIIQEFRIETTAQVWSCKRNKRNGKIEDTEKGIRNEL